MISESFESKDLLVSLALSERNSANDLPSRLPGSGVELLGSLPLDIEIREGVDNGKQTVAQDPNSIVSKNYRDIARNVAAKISLQAKDYTNKFPKIVIENN